MTGKLCKYEFRTSIRQIGIVWIALLISSVLLSAVIAVDRALDSNISAVNFITRISSTLYGVIMIAMFVMAVLIVVMRFYNSVCCDEGYLIHTLPVSKRSIIVSKGLTATAIVAISGIVALISIMIIMFGGMGGAFLDTVKCTLEEIGKEPKLIVIALESFVIVILGIMKSVYNVYAAISIGQMANRHRVLMSAVAYIAITMVLSTIVILVMIVADINAVGLFITANFSDWGIEQLVMLGAALVELLQIAVFHFISEVLLTRKLNLL